MNNGGAYRRQQQRKSGLKSADKCVNQLDFFGLIDDNPERTGTPVLVAPAPPNQDGGCISTMTFTQRTTTPTYSQDWPSYNLAQQNEKDRFLILLRDLCNTIPQEPKPRGKGRPSVSLSQRLFAATYKVYSGFSARRFTCDIKAARQRGLVDRAPHFNSTLRYLASAELTAHLKALIEISASPLASVETDFAIDSTGFATTTYSRWFDHKWGKERTRQTWVKTHIMSGVKTNIVTAAEATPTESADTKQLPTLLDRTAQAFDVQEVSADKAYSSRANIEAIDAIGAAPYIMFRKNATPDNGHHTPNALWSRMWHYYNLNRDEFLAHYHKRSNVETTVWMIKAKFGASVKSKSDTAQVNEVLCKILAHNVCVLIQSFYELGIETEFTTPASRDSKIIYLDGYRRDLSPARA